MISERAKNIVPSITGELSAKITDMKKQGIDIIKLNIGEPDFAPPANVSEAAIAAVHNGETKYVAIPGIAELREAICEKLEADNHIKYQSNEICVSTGAKQAVMNSLLAVCNPGDEIILPTPCWVSYTEMIKLAAGTPVFVPLSAETGFALDLAAIEKAITTKTKAIIICTPNNPTGAVYSEESLRQLADLALKHDFYIIVDEIYEKLVYDGASHFSIASISDEVRKHCITVNGFSKAFAIPGWRLGYSAAVNPVASSIKAIQSHMTSAANSIAQRAGIAALTGPQEPIETMRKEYARRRDYICDTLLSIPGIEMVKPQGAFYAFPKVDAFFGTHYKNYTINNAMDLAAYLLDEARIAVVFGEAFSMPGYLRLSYANSMENIQIAMERMKTALSYLEH